MHCAVHAVNNLLQRSEYQSADFDTIAKELSPSSWFWNNPHKSWLGNYDANVLGVALTRVGLEVEWLDKAGAERTGAPLVPGAPSRVCCCGCGELVGALAKAIPQSLKPQPSRSSASAPSSADEEPPVPAGLALLCAVEWERARGAIVNCRGSGGLLNADRHWFAVARIVSDALARNAPVSESIDGSIDDFTSSSSSSAPAPAPASRTVQWWNLDSRLARPQKLGCAALLLWVAMLRQPDLTVLVVGPTGAALVPRLP
jgi:hypothetical protein